MNIFFDVDDTLINTDDTRFHAQTWLRPGVHDVFERLKAAGHALYLWSGRGRRWEVVFRYGLRDHITDCFEKPLHDHHASLPRLGVPFAPDFVVDDHKEIVDVFGGMVIRAADYDVQDDREMWRALDEITAFAHRRGFAAARA